MPMAYSLLPVGELAARAGVRTSALRFYESEGLIPSTRTSGNQRRYRREVLRRVAFIRAAQAIGLSLEDIRSALDSLPSARTPNRRDWKRLSGTWRKVLDDRIAALERLRDSLESCIGCGCLSLDSCRLYNTGDHLADLGPGARLLVGDVTEG